MKSKPHIDVYTALMTDRHLLIRGRVLRLVPKPDYARDNFIVAMYKSIRRVLSFEVTDTELTIQHDDHLYGLKTDDEGYFLLEVARESLSPTVCISCRERMITLQVSDYTEVMPFGIISDIDDTVLVTNVRSLFKLKLILKSIFLNPYRRKAVKDAAQTYQRMISSMTGACLTFYISNSPWNMYHYLRTFLVKNRFPHGELILRDFGWHLFKRPKSIKEHNKYKEVMHTLALFPDTRFTLIGDASEMDFDIYMMIKQEHPCQVDQIIILQTGNQKNENRIKREMAHHDSEGLILVADYSQIEV